MYSDISISWRANSTLLLCLFLSGYLFWGCKVAHSISPRTWEELKEMKFEQLKFTDNCNKNEQNWKKVILPYSFTSNCTEELWISFNTEIKVLWEIEVIETSTGVRVSYFYFLPCFLSRRYSQMSVLSDISFSTDHNAVPFLFSRRDHARLRRQRKLSRFKKRRLRPFKYNYRTCLGTLILSNISEIYWSWILEDCIQVLSRRNGKKIRPRVTVHILHKTSRRGRSGDVKEMYQKSISLLMFSLLSSSQLALSWTVAAIFKTIRKVLTCHWECF